MKLIDGLWWPDDDVRGRPFIVSQCREAMPVVMALVPNKGTVVQAGGNVGVYPLRLAEHFRTILTFEPDPDNFACLDKNLDDSWIERSQAALGRDLGSCRMEVVEADNCGAHKIQEGGDIPVICIDDLGLTECDLIWLDIEGHEAAAIEGARQTIEAFSPVIVLEEKGLGQLADLPGYDPVLKVGNDTVYVHRQC